MLRGEQCQEPSTGNLDLGRKLLDACKNGETEEVRDLMQNGAPFTTDWLGTSPLHFAAQHGHTDTAEFLLRSGVSRDTRTKVERTPLHVSSQEGHLQIVNLLLMHGADIDARDLLKMTPLHWAVERGHYDVVECLLANGADLNLLSKFDKTPIDIARDSGRTDMIPLLERYINVSRPRQDNRSTSNTNNSCFAKTRPTVLPNKSNRTAKIVKPIGSVNSNSTAKGNSSSSSTSSSSTVTANISKTSVDALKKLLNGTGINLEDGSNNVLTTLAALADATGQTTGNVINNNSQIAADALQWLDTHGATSALEESMFASAIESGGTVSLTEAGKLALNCVKDSSLSPTTSQQQTSSLSSSSTSVTTLNNSTKLDPDLEGKVIQIVGELENNQVTSPIVLLSSNSDGTLTTTTTDQTEPIRIKKIVKTVAGKPISVTNLRTTTNLTNSKLNLIESNGCKVISNAVASITSPSTPTTITINHNNNNNTTSSPNVNNNIINLNNNNNNNNNSNSDKEKERLRKELERTKREAEEYKAQLREKEKEAELYKRQLEVYKSKFKD